MAKGSIGFTEILDFFDTENMATSAADGVRWLITSDTGDTAWAATAASEGPFAQATVTTTDDQMVELAHSLVTWEVQHGELEMEVCFELDVVTTVAFNIGFNDDALEDSNTLPAELATTTWTSNAGTFIGFVFDTDATNDNLHAFWVDDDSDTTTAIATLRFTDAVPTAGEWGVYRVHLQDQGSGNQVRATLTFIDHSGRGYEKTFSSTIDRDHLLTPYIGIENRSATAHVPKVKYAYIRQSMK